MKIIVDKIASVTKNIPLKNKVTITNKIISKEGYVIVVEVLEDKKLYNKLELPSGRLSTIHKGDILVTALGNRRAQKGYVGEVPKNLMVGDTINLLNLGGVSGICTSENIREVGPAMKVKALGAVIDSKKKHVTIFDYRLFTPAKKIKSKIPLIVVSGTCMEIGKTSAACEVIKSATRSGYKTCGAKVAGIAALRDTTNMQDYGAKEAVSIVDAGYTSSIDNYENNIQATKGAINYLAKSKPDYIIVELGDGILGAYGVLNILEDKEFKMHIKAHIGCAYDPPGAMKLQEICTKIGAPLDIVSGPVTDNSFGKQFVRDYLNIRGINSLAQGDKIFPYLQKKCLGKNKK